MFIPLKPALIAFMLLLGVSAAADEITLFIQGDHDYYLTQDQEGPILILTTMDLGDPAKCTATSKPMNFRLTAGSRTRIRLADPNSDGTPVSLDLESRSRPPSTVRLVLDFRKGAREPVRPVPPPGTSRVPPGIEVDGRKVSVRAKDGPPAASGSSSSRDAQGGRRRLTREERSRDFGLPQFRAALMDHSARVFRGPFDPAIHADLGDRLLELLGSSGSAPGFQDALRLGLDRANKRTLLLASILLQFNCYEYIWIPDPGALFEEVQHRAANLPRAPDREAQWSKRRLVACCLQQRFDFSPYCEGMETEEKAPDPGGAAVDGDDQGRAKRPRTSAPLPAAEPTPPGLAVPGAPPSTTATFTNGSSRRSWFLKSRSRLAVDCEVRMDCPGSQRVERFFKGFSIRIEVPPKGILSLTVPQASPGEMPAFALVDHERGNPQECTLVMVLNRTALTQSRPGHGVAAVERGPNENEYRFVMDSWAPAKPGPARSEGLQADRHPGRGEGDGKAPLK